MIRKTLLHLRQKPKSIRNNVAMGIAGAVTFMVFLVWASYIPERFSVLSSAPIANPDKAIFSNFFDLIGRQFANVGDSVAPEVVDPEVFSEQNILSGSGDELSASGEDWKQFFSEPEKSFASTGSSSVLSGALVSTTSSTTGPAPSQERVVRLVPVSANSVTSSTESN